MCPQVEIVMVSVLQNATETILHFTRYRFAADTQTCGSNQNKLSLGVRLNLHGDVYVRVRVTERVCS